MPKPVELFLQFKEKDEVFVDPIRRPDKVQVRVSSFGKKSTGMEACNELFPEYRQGGLCSWLMYDLLDDYGCYR